MRPDPPADPQRGSPEPLPVCRYGVLGWPVAHSRSPAMHEAAYRALGLERHFYQRLPVPPDLFEETVRALPAAGFAGANVTIPHKAAALAIADTATPQARAIGAANTLTFDAAGAIEAANTDAPGLIAALPVSPAGATALVLGAGGSARAAVWALLDAGAYEVRVWNRTPDRAQALVAELGATLVTGDAAPAEIVVNCTAAGLEDPESAFEQLPLSPGELARFGCVVDLVYGDAPSALVDAARAAGVPAVDGLEILVRQGALSLERWLGRPAPLDAMRAGARTTSRAAPPAPG